MLNLVYINSGIFNLIDANKKQIIVVPEFFSHHYERELCEKLGNSANKNVEISSFKSISSRILADIGGLSKNYINDSGRTLALFRALDKASYNLKIFRNAKNQNIEQILSIIDEFKIYKITENMILEAAESIDGILSDKLRDLYYIFTEYNKITSKDIKDPRDEMDFICEHIENCKIYDNTDIFFAGFESFSPQQYEFITKFLLKGNNITILLDIQQMDNQMYDLYFVARQTKENLIKICKRHNIKYNEKIGNIEKRTFSELNLFEVYEIQSNLDVNLHISQSVKNECMNLCSNILKLVANGKYRFKDILVTSRDFDNYRKYLEIEFKRYGIAYFMTDKEQISSKLPIRLLVDSLDIINNNFKTESVMRFLKSEISHIDKESSDILEDYVIRWNIPYLSEGVVFKSNPSFNLKKLADDEKEKLESINLIKKMALKPVYKLNEKFKNCSTGSEFIEALYNYCLDINLPQSILEYSEKQDLKKNYDEYMQLWDIIINSFDQFVEICDNQNMNTEEFIKLYKNILCSYEVATIPSAIDNVFAGEFERISGEKCKVLFVLGADKESLPKKIVENTILTDDDRDILEINDIKLSMYGGHLVEMEFGLINKIFTLAEDKLYVSFSEISAGGNINEPSQIFQKLAKNFDVSTDISINFSFMQTSEKTYLEYICKENQAVDGEFKEKYNSILEKSKKTYDFLTKETLEKIYTNNISPSRIEVFNSCKFMYFLQYGLAIKDRRIITFDKLENGNFIHFVLENILKEYKAEVSVRQKTADAIEMYMREYLSENMLNDPRFEYVITNLKNTTHKIVENIIDEINSSDFKPEGLEVEISEKSDVKPLKVMDFNIVGKVDRVDIYDEGVQKYLRVIDYKSGVKKMDLSTFNYGLGMQMFIYSMILSKNMNIDSKGVLYIPTKSAKITSEIPISSENLHKEVQNYLKRSGLVLKDEKIVKLMEKNNPFIYLPVKFTKGDKFHKGSDVANEQRFAAIETLVNEKIEETINSIKDGQIYANPYKSKERSPCDYCKFSIACGFCDEYDKKRELIHMTREEFFENLGVGDDDE